ncbi:MAG: DUF4097 family beta strand repeat-containing protein [Treponema sp.]|nr:DUF4097 family beta strand repeat-containing protein [Treponema sp.]
MNNFLDFYKNNRGTILVIIWILAFLVIGFFILSQVSKRISNSTTAISENNLYKSYTFETTQLDNIEINLISEHLIVQPANDNKITVELYGSWNSQIEPNIDCNNSNLIIKQKTKRFFNFRQKLVLVKLPVNAVSPNTNFNAVLISGRFEMHDFNLNKMNVETVSGTSFIKNIESEKLDVNSVSGKINIENSTIKELDVYSTSGALNIEGMYNEISAEAVSGKITVTNKKDFENDSDFSAISGSIQLYLPADANPELNCSSTSGHVYSEYHDSKTKKLKDKIGSGLYELKAKSVSGSVKINKLNK